MLHPQPLFQRLKMTIQYDGTHFCGWAKQLAAKPSVQGALESAIEKITGRAIRVYGAGRTDSGVHALRQVAHFDIPLPNADTQRTEKKKSLCQEMHSGINHYLKISTPQALVTTIENVGAEFHSRRSAKSRRYLYRVHIGNNCPIFHRNLCWSIKHLPRPDLIQKVCDMFVGTHDFSSFRSKGCSSLSPIKNVMECSFEREPADNHFFSITSHDTNEGEFWRLSIEANSFMYHQVRNMMGFLVTIGQEKLTLEEAEVLFKDRTPKGSTLYMAPPQGLFFADVKY